jgi:hypothetical protein
MNKVTPFLMFNDQFEAVMPKTPIHECSGSTPRCWTSLGDAIDGELAAARDGGRITVSRSSTPHQQPPRVSKFVASTIRRTNR